MASDQTPHILLGSGGGIIPSSDPKTVASIIENLKSLPIKIYGIDTAAIYGGGKPGLSETNLGEADAINSGLVIDTKVLVFGAPGASSGPLSRENINKSMDDSLEKLKAKKVRALYAHAPDKTTPAADTVAGFGDVLKAGKAEIWGLSNYSPKQVSEVLAECEKQGVPKPRLYQGMYNAVCRKLEEELIPMLRANGIKYYAYSPSAGGFLAAKVATSNATDLPSRFQPGGRMAQSWNARFNKPEIVNALAALHSKCEKQGTTIFGASLRWLTYHSKLGKDDAVILGASKVSQLEESATEIAKGTLPDGIAQEFEKLWETVKDVAPVGYSD